MQSEAAIFKVLSDPTRLRLAVLLSLRAETCVCELAQAIGAADFNISRHLSIMRAAGLVEARREGTWMFYRLSAARTRLEERLLACLRECLADHPTVQSDLKRLSGATCEPREAPLHEKPEEPTLSLPAAEAVVQAP